MNDQTTALSQRNPDFRPLEAVIVEMMQRFQVPGVAVPDRHFRSRKFSRICTPERFSACDNIVQNCYFTNYNLWINGIDERLY